MHAAQATLRVTELEYRCSEMQAEAEAAAQRHELARKAAAEEAEHAQRAAVQRATEEARSHGRDEALKSSNSNAAALEAQARRYEAMTALMFSHLHLLARVVADAQDKIQHRARLLIAMQVRGGTVWLYSFLFSFLSFHFACMHDACFLPVHQHDHGGVANQL